MIEKKMPEVKWERRSHIYTRWANWVISKNNYIVCEMQYWFLDIDSGDIYLFVGFWKCIVAETQHWIIDAFSTFFSFDFENALLPKRNINSLISFPHYF